MTAAQLKASILDQAIRGKLVPQDPNDEPADILLKRIADAKVKATQGRARRPATAATQPITDDEKPFDLPKGWAWVRLKDVVFNHGQKKPISRFCYIDIGSICNKYQRLNDEETILMPSQASSRARKIVHKGDVIYSCVRPYLHNIAIIDREFSLEPIASTGFAVMAAEKCLDNRYLFYFLLSPVFDEYANSGENAKGIAYPAISDARLYSALVPLPPLAEQKRIVAKVEELLPLVEKYGAAYERKRKLIADLPEKLRKSILQEAIQGKLVPQDPNDEPADILLKRIAEAKVKAAQGRARRPATAATQPITDEEKPFDLPKGWAWCRLGDIASKVGAGSTPLGGCKVYVQTGVKFLREQNVQDAGLRLSNVVFISRTTHESMAGSCVCAKDILINITGASIGRNSLVPDDFDEANVNQHVLIVRLAVPEIRKFLHQWLMSPMAYLQMLGHQKGDKPGLSAERVKGFLIPLPPLAEQKRIVAKVEELLADVEKLKRIMK